MTQHGNHGSDSPTPWPNASARVTVPTQREAPGVSEHSPRAIGVAKVPTAEVRSQEPGEPTSGDHTSGLSQDERIPNRFRPDVEGLRAVAVLAVLLYHARVQLVPGGFAGVDIFFVISGFLITTLLISEVNRTGKISIAGFYARRAKRLLPAAGLVLLATVVLVRIFIPRTRWMEVGGDIVSAALYVVNWRFADRSVDYLAEDSQPSPVQHFWSLAVEEQFYFVWPLLLLLAVLLARVFHVRPKPMMWLGILMVMVPSYAWSIIETASVPERAFFETTTRMWELGVGATIALSSLFWAKLPKALAIALGWIGVVAILWAATLLTIETAWPGYAAALPVLGTAAVIAAGFSAGKGGPIALLGTRPLVWIGALSYSLYLWHWPLLVIATQIRGELTELEGLAIVAASVVLAWITYKTVENPLRRSKSISSSPRFALSLGANFTLVGVVGGLTVLLATAPAVGVSNQVPPGSALGAAVLGPTPRNSPHGDPVDDVGWMTPLPTQATADIPRAHAEGCQLPVATAQVVTCDYGDPQGSISIAVVGDSKATQWTPGLETLAGQNSWRMITYLKSSCSFTLAATELDGKPYPLCREWTDAVLARLLSDPPDYVVTTQGQSAAIGPSGKAEGSAMVKGLRDIWSKLTDAGSRIIVIADNPHPGMNVYECVEQNPRALSNCAFDRERYSSSAAPVQHEAANGQDGVAVVDLFDAICPANQCAPVIGNVLVYRQGSHITATYIKTLTPRLATALSDVGLEARYA